MKFLLDTDTCIYLMKGSSQKLLRRFEQSRQGDVAVSSITVAELAFGASKSARSESHVRLQVFLSPLAVVDFDAMAALHHGELRSHLERDGKPIGPLDTLIAAHALSLDLTLITNNTREFGRVPGLRSESWI
ncbi:MAG: type II toxin-antitoxin system VapC family toxin [Rubrivivax sp.]